MTYNVFQIHPEIGSPESDFDRFPVRLNTSAIAKPLAQHTMPPVIVAEIGNRQPADTFVISKPIPLDETEYAVRQHHTIGSL